MISNILNMNTAKPPLILASQSPYRRELLARLAADFECRPAAVDETPAPGEKPAELALRLAISKAEVIATAAPDAIVIGSDQVAALGDEPLSKPGTHERAVAQLAACSGRQVVFHTAVAVLHKAADFRDTHTDITTVTFRPLSDADIESYLRLDEPYDCAGSFRAEAHGPLLFESLESRDPVAIIGLPLIWLAASLRRSGLDLLQPD